MSDKAREKFRLLDLSSDEQSSDLQLEIIPRKKKVTRRDRNRSTPPRPPEGTLRSDLKCALIWGLRGALLVWLILLTCLSASLYDQVSTMKADVTKVSSSSNGVSDALQICHTAAKELQANATELNHRLTDLEKKHLELSSLVQQASSQLDAVNAQLNSAPSLADTPKHLADLERTVSNLGSQISSFDTALQTSKQSLSAAKSSIAEIEQRTNATIANITAHTNRIDVLEHTIDNVNGTVYDRLQAFENKLANITMAASSPATVAPPPPTAVTTAATTISTAPPATTPAAAVPTSSTTLQSSLTTRQEPPAKPSLLSEK